MKLWFRIYILALLGLGVACSSEDEEYDTQSEYIVSFLESKHSPTLISYQEAITSIDEDLPFYTEFINSSYRYIRDYYDSSRDGKSEITSSSTITITYWVYDFSGYSQPDEYTTEPIYTNDPTLEDALIALGLNTTWWDFSPKIIKLSSEDSIIIGAREALIGCKEGDFVEIYMTYNTAYGDNIVGVIEKMTPMAMFCRVDSVE